jgi:uncharacterized membrane protein YozB (DUF420 family)
MDVRDLPTLNALLNTASGILLARGYWLIRRRRIEQHRWTMTAAFITSCLFLISYLVYHAAVGSVPFGRQGWIRPVYFTILITHVILAASIVPLALITLFRAWRGRFTEHRRIARWTFPLWMYVSVTGVVVYWMLYHM